ncbi:MAG: ABC transporter ATP-binding protein [Aeromicrobium sp.]|nr:ABC transporter ATP-binding protein [Burkholderiales bacterium]
MSDIAISIEHLSKSYLVGHNTARAERYTALRDVVSRNARNLVRKTRDMLSGRAIVQGDEVEEFWALKDVSFEVKRGEVLGVIGRNGAGKSTLLKILSRITAPTDGRIKIAGRVASLLEVGTGFHPELSGRENIFLNGAILGMKRIEIQRKFDEIVAFAEVERFLDMPVKRYSSGMYARLAFSVAAHLEPDVLIVDEVLAVGDASFQKKCMGAMRDASTRDGKTVLFVSHNLSAIRTLCTSSLVLSGGEQVFSGPVADGLARYAKLTEISEVHRSLDRTRPCIEGASVDEELASEGHLALRVLFSSPWTLSPVLIGAVIHNEQRMPIFGINTDLDPSNVPISAKSGVAVLKIQNLSLYSGTYTVDIYLGEKNENYDVVESAVTFTFISPSNLTSGLSTDLIGSMRVNGQWRILSK